VAGETPIPCVSCNQQIKFKDLLDTAAQLGAEELATGHYIEKRDGPRGPMLYTAADQDRDQSYFLFATTREQLERLRFPLGAILKSDVRRMALDLGLAVAEKPDSQDICFVPRGHYADIIEKLKPGAVRDGEIVHADGRVLGRHNGIVHFTVGQRRGLKIADGEALYVLRLDAARNRVVVGPRDNLHTKSLTLKNVNWLGDEPLAGDASGVSAFVRIRSTGQVQPASLLPAGKEQLRVVLEDGEYGVAAGQACVFYDKPGPGARVLGGGWIANAVTSPASIESPEPSHQMISSSNSV
jgi:tRNA-specific 2-thiouridylase